MVMIRITYPLVILIITRYHNQKNYFFNYLMVLIINTHRLLNNYNIKSYYF